MYVCVYVYFEYMSTHLDTNMNGLFDIYIYIKYSTVTVQFAPSVYCDL